MANALGELFANIAYEIKVKRGEDPGTTKYKPTAFPEKIREISAGIDTSNATATEYDLASGATAYVGGEKITGALEVHHTAQAEAEEVYDSGGSVKMSLTNMERAIYDSGAVITVSAPLEEFGDATAEDVAVGKTFTSADGMLVVGTGSGSGGGGSSDELCYVTFMSHDGTEEYGKKAVAVGDDCANPIERGIFDTPSIGPTDQYIRLFDGWSTTINGETDEDALKAVWEDRTVYATYVNNVRSYFIRFYDGDTLIHSVSYNYGEMPSYTPTKDGYDFVAWEPELTTVTGEASYTATWKAKAAFATASWAEIAAVSASGKASETFALGNKREVTIDGTKYELEIAGFDHDNLADGSGKAGISIISRTIVTTGAFYNSTYPSSGKWENSAVRNWLINTFMPKLPDDLKSVIKEVNKISCTTRDGGLETLAEKIWIPSAEEMSEVPTTIDNTSMSNFIVRGQGTKYAWYTDNARRIRYKNGTAGYIFTRTRNMQNASSHFAILATGAVNKYATSSSSNDIAFGFCI